VKAQGSSIDRRSKAPALLAIEGWYEVASTLSGQTVELYERYLQSGSTLKFTRWLARNGSSPAEVSAIGKQLKPVSVKVSCRHNDLVRLADTGHYKSCMAGDMGVQQIHYLADPDIAVVFLPDAAGKFMWRSLLRLVMEGDKFALVHYRIYGNGPTSSIFKALSKKTGLNIYSAVDINEYNNMESKIFTSPTVHNNRLLFRPRWTDHLVGQTEAGRTWIKAHTTPY
jgi:hypothetical protein